MNKLAQITGLSFISKSCQQKVNGGLRNALPLERDTYCPPDGMDGVPCGKNGICRNGKCEEPIESL